MSKTLKELLAAVKEQTSLAEEEDAEAPQGAVAPETTSTVSAHGKPGHDLAGLEELFGSMEQDHR